MLEMISQIKSFQTLERDIKKENSQTQILSQVKSLTDEMKIIHTKIDGLSNTLKPPKKHILSTDHSSTEDFSND